MAPSPVSPGSPINTEILGWNDLDDQAISYARALAADAVQRAGNGHPGTAMALAPWLIFCFNTIYAMTLGILSGSGEIDSSFHVVTLH